MDKLIVTKERKEIIPLSQQEIEQINQYKQAQEEQNLIENLKPSEKEVLMAEIELNTINLLLELGVF